MTAAEHLPPKLNLTALRAAVDDCRGCPLWKPATQAVFGEGRRGARVMLVGEQPGDREDREGRPFVGPAGKVLDRALEEAGIERSDVYITNVVKHFKFTERGTRRIHQKPNAKEIDACEPWFDAELTVIRPELLVCLGATAAKAVIGPSFSVTKQRGEIVELHDVAPLVAATVHPSSILRAPDDEARRRARQDFTADLASAAGALEEWRAARH